ncbi:hypothetical protein M2132_000465 [Dysgonomonas sp. PH5-45]|uniref:hypothetical protein n=1 Tax=unclassified Dysgonomonas TaxID=2630389 RepID=UPI002475046E|nr:MULTISPECIES: hypothetical protein [unclassified Dysgonomonas]MDH6354143.1 hypothetical protein [Dysgonomonas sp. PH5-45]MDH6387006.1 hypothetical protein [Dysgonomonas sp. PH5-37]
MNSNTQSYESFRRICVLLLLLALNIGFLTSFVFRVPLIVLGPATVLFALLAFNFKTISKGYLFIMIFLCFIMVMSPHYYKRDVLLLMTIMQASLAVDIKTYLKYILVILGVVSVIMFFLYGFGRLAMFENNSDIENLIRARYDFGFRHPNAASTNYYGLIIASILLLSISKYRKMLPMFVVGAMLFAMFIYTMTMSRGFLIAILAFVCTYGYYSLRKKISENYKLGVTKYIILVLPLILSALTLFLGLNAENFPLIDIILSNRPSLYGDFLSTLTPEQLIFGTTFMPTEELVIDSSYLTLMFAGGLVFFVYFIALYFIAAKNIIKQQNTLVIAILVGTMAYGFVETTLLGIMNIGNTIFWALLYKYRFGVIEEFGSSSEEELTDEDVNELVAEEA